MRKIVAMILAGGRGKRMGMLCQIRPKPLLQFGGGFRVIDFTLSNCIHSQIANVSLVTDYKRLQLAEYSKIWQLANNQPAIVTALEPSNSSYRGTADAIYQNLDYITRNNAETVVILAGDHVYKMDYRTMIAFHDQTKADVTVAVTRVPQPQANHFGIVSVNGENRVINFTEKPMLPASNLASMGIYVFSKAALFDCLSKNAVNCQENYDFGYSVFPNLVKNYNVFAYEHQGYWRDIGTLETYYAANMDSLRHDLFPGMNGNWPILTNGALYCPNTNHHSDDVNSIISSGCVIRGKVENSILSPGVWVEEHAIVRNSILMANVFVGYHSVIDGCIVDEGAHISRFSFVGFHGAVTGNYSELTVLGKDVIVPPYTAIMRNSKVPAYAALGQHNGKMKNTDAPVSFSPIYI